MSKTAPPEASHAQALGVPVDLLLRHCVELDTQIREKDLRAQDAITHRRFSEAERLQIEIEGLRSRQSLYQHLCRTYSVPLDATWSPEASA